MKKLVYLLTALFCFSVVNAQKNNLNKSAGITISLPLINNVSFYRYSTDGEGGNGNQGGYLGAGVALFYQENQNKFSLVFESPLMSKSLFLPKGGNSNISTNIFEATIHHKVLSQVALIGGLNYATYRFQVYTDIPPFPKVDKRDETIGFTAGAEFLPSKSTSVIVTYRPSIFCFDKKSYRAIFSLGITYDIKFWKK